MARKNLIDCRTAYIGISAIIQARSRGEKGFLPIFPYLGVIVLGIASAVYHLSLKYYTQLRTPRLSNFSSL